MVRHCFQSMRSTYGCVWKFGVPQKILLLSILTSLPQVQLGKNGQVQWPVVARGNHLAVIGWSGWRSFPSSWSLTPRPRRGTACPQGASAGADWASFASAYRVRDWFCWSSGPGLGFICSSLSPCYVFGPEAIAHETRSGNGPLKEAFFNLLQGVPS